MKTRAQPLTIPDTRIYVEIDVPGHGKHHFRLPRIGRALELIDLFPRDEGSRTVQILSDGSQRDAMRHYAGLEERCATLIGELWYHPTLELESERGNAPALAEEFHEAGYTPTELYSLSISLLEPLGSLLWPMTEAKKDGGPFEESSAGETPN